MAGDYTRLTFSPWGDRSGVFMQQGRVQLDADWNELVEVLDRRWRAETTDLVGRGVVPKETPDGFHVQAAGGTFTIGRGRVYVDGLLAENHGKAPLELDPVLGEVRGTQALDYAEQPYLPNPGPLPAGGPHLVYVDVWSREVTVLEDPAIMEKAVGVDTATRAQTAWQVRVLPNVGAGVTCATPDDQMPGWLDVVRPSAGRLTTTAVGVPSSSDPCIIPPDGGYRGLENRLYRVEIHDAGALGAATFKWSHNNGSVATTVTGVNAAGDQITVVRTGRDAVLRFNAGDWVEVTDNWRELGGKPGEMRKVQAVDDVRQTITLATPLPAGAFDASKPERHTRVRHWDQQGAVRDQTGTIVADVDASGGVIPVPATGMLVLEDGVAITFSSDPPGGNFHVADYWSFAARTADASVEALQAAPPRGIYHHYCRLAIVTFPASATDCRVLWPPDVTGGGCDCSVCVTTESHNSGVLTVQRAIDAVKATGGTVCLGPGLYRLRESLQITGARSVVLKGEGWETVLVQLGSGPAIAVESSLGVTIQDLSVLTPRGQPNGDGGAPALSVRLLNSIGVTVQRCIILQTGPAGGGAAISFEGFLLQMTLANNLLAAPIGVQAVRPNRTIDDAWLFTANLSIRDNVLACRQSGISMDQGCVHLLATALSGNLILGCDRFGIATLGLAPPGSTLDVQGNTIKVSASGQGIVVGTGETRIADNDVDAANATPGGAGIVLAPGLDGSGLTHCQVAGNRVRAVAGHGIELRGRVQSAIIKQNVVDGVGGGGIVMEGGSTAGSLSVENNQLFNLWSGVKETQQAVAGIRLLMVDQGEVSQNLVVGVGQSAVQSLGIAGIQVLLGNSVRVAGNEIADFGPSGQFINRAVGIEARLPRYRLDVTDNAVRRTQQLPSAVDTSAWLALAVDDETKSVTSDGSIAILAGRSTMYSVTGNIVGALPLGTPTTAVRGNLLDAYGGAPAALIATRGPCLFGENRCLLTSGKASSAVAASAAIVMIAASAVVASANYVQGPPDLAAILIQTPKAEYTVLGNIVTGAIRVPTGTLPAPWAPLNTHI